MRSKYGSYKEYHTSKDNLNFISQKGFQGSFSIYRNIIDIFLKKVFFIKLKPYVNRNWEKEIFIQS